MAAEGVSRLSPFRWLSPGGAGARLSIFIFHRVLPQPDPLLPDEPDAARFDRIVALLARHFHVLPLSEAAAALAEGRLPPAAACITFDDGYADNHDVAAPILRRHGLSATFFIATGYIDGGRMWNDTIIEAVRRAPDGHHDWRAHEGIEFDVSDVPSRVRAYSAMLKRLKHLEPAQRQRHVDGIAEVAGLASHSDLMMSRAQVVALRDMGMEIGAHTISHPILRSVSDAEARREVFAGRDILEDWLRERPRVFAYPNGVPGSDYGERDVQIVKDAGFLAAVSTSPGVSTVNSDRFQLRRFTPWDQSMGRFALRCALNILRSPAAV